MLRHTCRLQEEALGQAAACCASCAMFAAACLKQIPPHLPSCKEETCPSTYFPFFMLERNSGSLHKIIKGKVLEV